MAQRKFKPQEISIKNSQITLTLSAEEAAMLAKACSIATKNTLQMENEKDAIAFRAYAGMFKAATIASISHGYMDSQQHQRGEKSVNHLLEMVEGEYGGL